MRTGVHASDIEIIMIYRAIDYTSAKNPLDWDNPNAFIDGQWRDG